MEIFWTLTKIVGTILFLYLTWRDLRDDYQEQKLVSYSWLALLATLVGGRVVYGLIHWGVWNSSLGDWFQLWQKPGFNFGGGILGLLILTWGYCRVSGWKFWPFLEEMTPILYLFGFLIFDGSWLVRLIILAGFLLAKFMKNKYRSIVWYRSGKKGFIFFFVNMLVALMLALLSIIIKDGQITVVLYLITSLMLATGLFILGEMLN